MKRYIHILVNIFVFSFLFLIQGIYGYLYDLTNPIQNSFTIKNTTSYTVIHQAMDIDGINYTNILEEDFTGITIGTTVEPAVLDLPGFTSPPTQTVTLNDWNNTVITYSYTRNQYTLTITNSQYVTTQTPTGQYYYGQQIHLIADDYDNQNSPFLKWSDETTNKDYTFTLVGNTTIGPVYVNTYNITYVPNNGDSSFTDIIIENEPITTFPDVEYNDCSSGAGTYQQLGCTYVYEFLGWYKEPNFVNKVDETFVPTEDTTLYAKWNKIYFHNDSTTFDGTNYLDTEIALFSQENARKDFIVTFSYDDLGNGTENPQLLFTDLNEGNPGNPVYPGVSFKYMKNNSRYDLVANVASGNNTVGGRMTTTLDGFGVGDDVVLKREHGQFSYSLDGGNTFKFLNNFSNFNLYFDVPAVFGAGYSNGSPPIYRYFVGTLSNMTVQLFEPASYTIHYDANGGTGVMPDQVIELGTNTNLSSLNFVNGDAAFTGWNTEPDGSGTSYPDGYQITSDLGNDGDVITLYAQWLPPDYHVTFDANGGDGTMTNQAFMFNSPQALKATTFTKTGYIFEKWNTAPDGTGTSYDDQEIVSNLTNVQDGSVTLYAIYEKIEYEHIGDIVFDGVDDFVDTGVNPYLQSTLNKDFDIKFTITAVDTYNATSGQGQATALNMKEENSSINYPGLAVRLNENSSSPLHIVSRWNSNRQDLSIQSNKVPIVISLKRRGTKVYVRYTHTNTDSGWIELYDQSTWNLQTNFSSNIMLGSSYINGANTRFWAGTISDIQIAMAE